MNRFQVLSISLLTIVFVVVLIRILTHSPLKRSSTVKATLDVSEYGFGENKQLIIIDLTSIGEVSKIDPDDKQYARMSWSDANNPIKYKDIGIEFKGGTTSRQKLNYGIELWEDKDENTTCSATPDTCDDRKEKLFGFDEKYEDFILKSSEQDPAFIIGVLPHTTDGGIIENTLVEVLIKIGDDMYYEGVYVLYSAIKRRLLEKRLNWEDDLGHEGKAEDCDDSDYDIEHTAIIAEYTTPTDNTDRKKPCKIFSDYNIKMKYPKCEDYDSSEFASCRNDYVNRTEFFMSVLSGKNTSVVPLHYESFAKKYYLDLLLQKPDIGENSDYFVVTPDSKLYSGPRWDYEWTNYHRMFSIEGFDLYHITFNKQMPLYKTLGKTASFIEKVKNMSNTIDVNQVAIDHLIELRTNQTSKGYFDRNNERWDVLGKNYRVNSAWILLGERSLTEDTMQKEVDFWGDRLKARNKWLKDNIHTLEEFDFIDPMAGYIAVAVTLYLVPLILAGILVWVSCTRKTSEETNGYEVLPKRELRFI